LWDYDGIPVTQILNYRFFSNGFAADRWGEKNAD